MCLQIMWLFTSSSGGWKKAVPIYVPISRLLPLFLKKAKEIRGPEKRNEVSELTIGRTKWYSYLKNFLHCSSYYVPLGYLKKFERLFKEILFFYVYYEKICKLKNFKKGLRKKIKITHMP